MARPIHHHAYIEAPFAAVCDELERNGVRVVETATHAASGFAADLAGYLEDKLGFFDRDERVIVGVGAIERSDGGAVLPIEWHADDTRRFLPNVEAAIHVTPLISSGPGATSEITLRGTYSPLRIKHRGIVEHALVRRVVDATLHVFLRHLADELQAHTAVR